MSCIKYKKSYDSVLHRWILEVSQIYKINEKVKSNRLYKKKGMSQYKLKHEKGLTEVDNTKIKVGIFLGDFISSFLFILAINILSTLINKQNAYRINPPNKNTGKYIKHLFYIDDLILYAPNRQEIM